MATWPLTGRAEELKLIADVLSGDGEHVGVVIAGRAGVGKTRLAHEAGFAASALGWVVRWVVGTVAAQSIPLGAFAQWADEVDNNPLQLARRIIAAITTSPNSRPVLVAVDDAHLLDSLSAFVLHQLVLQRVATVIATVRTGEPAPDAVIALWKDAHLRRLDLQPLSGAECNALLESALGGRVSSQCAHRMWRSTRGNVLFLRHLVDQELRAGRLINSDDHWQWVGAMAVSPSLIEMVELHVGAASAPVLDVVDLVVVAEPLELVYLASLADPEVIEESERRGLIAVSRGSPSDFVRVGHPLYGEIRLAKSGLLRLRRLRGRIAHAMTAPEIRLGQPDPVRLGLLWLESDLPPDRDLFVRAAMASMTRLDLALSERLADAAVRAAAGVEAQLLRAQLLSLLSRAEEADQVLATLSAGQLPDAVRITALLVRAANMHWSLARPEESRKLIDDALAVSSGQVARALLAFRAVQLATAARPAEALALRDVIDRGELAAVPAMMWIWARTVALCDLGCPLQAAAVADEGAALAATSPEAAYQAILLGIFHMEALVFGGYITQAVTVAECMYQQCADVPGITRAITTAINGMAALGNGNLPAAVECLQSAVDDCRRYGTTNGLSYNFMLVYTEALARSGDSDAALDAQTEIQRSRHPAFVYLESNRLLATAWVAAARGRTSEAQALAARAAEFACTHGQYAREVMCLQAAVQFGDKQQAPRLAELASLVEGPRASLAARWASALARDDGDALQGVSCEFEVMGDRMGAADAAAHASLAFTRENRRGAALTASGRADRIITDCGGRTPATQAAAAPLPLSTREREIATLVANGLSNKEIAEVLDVSVRTVEGHLYRTGAKLGVSTRAELVHLMAEFARRGPS